VKEVVGKKKKKGGIRTERERAMDSCL